MHRGAGHKPTWGIMRQGERLTGGNHCGRMGKSTKEVVIAVIEVAELVGTSPTNWHEAVANAVAEEAKAIRSIKAVDGIHFGCGIQKSALAGTRLGQRVRHGRTSNRVVGVCGAN